MTLHIFNPEHDIALAANLANFTAPHAGRQLRHDLGFIPALWAEEGDSVLVDNPERAAYDYDRFLHAVNRQLKGYAPVRKNFLPRWENKISSSDITKIQPWGWDVALKARLKRSGADERLLPTDAQLDVIRQLSHRRTSAQLLPLLQCEGTVGESSECHTEEEIHLLLERYGRLVLKAPWSSSGRGLRFVNSTSFTTHQAGWLRNLFATQGSVMAEPFFDKEKDFGMEFYAGDDGSIRYLGLSLFHTANGAYTGNILATENKKREMISRYISIELLDSINENICSSLPAILKGGYTGPFGVDMMVVKGERFLLHPCVEINLRRTMGHVALALTPTDDEMVRVMRIEFADGRYKMKVERV